MRRRQIGYFDDPWYMRFLKWMSTDVDVREPLSQSTDAEGNFFRLVGRRGLLQCDLPDKQIQDLLERRQQAVAAALEITRGDLPRVADAVRDFFVAEGICPACAHPLDASPASGGVGSPWRLCNECGRLWSPATPR